tara:strand:- start:57 stop:419 length:363 start_codon:yes stop_codon:yes gene_type:complete
MNKKTYQNYKSDYIYLNGGNSIKSINETKFNELYNMTESEYKKYSQKRDFKTAPKNKYTNIFHIYSILVSNALLSEIQSKNTEFLTFLYKKNQQDKQIINDSAKKTLIKFYGGKIPMLRS